MSAPSPLPGLFKLPPKQQLHSSQQSIVNPSPAVSSPPSPIPSRYLPPKRKSSVSSATAVIVPPTPPPLLAAVVVDPNPDPYYGRQKPIVAPLIVQQAPPTEQKQNKTQPPPQPAPVTPPPAADSKPKKNNKTKNNPPPPPAPSPPADATPPPPPPSSAGDGGKKKERSNVRALTSLLIFPTYDEFDREALVKQVEAEKVAKLRRVAIGISLFSLFLGFFFCAIPAVVYAFRGPVAGRRSSPRRYYMSVIALSTVAIVFATVCWIAITITNVCHFYYYVFQSHRFVSGDCQGGDD